MGGIISEKTVETTTINPWRRYFARCIDVGTIGMLVCVVALFFAPSLLSEDNNVLLGIVMGLSVVALETFLLFAFGTTLGKAIFRINIKQSTGEKITLRQALKRSVDVYISGCAFYIPLVSFVTAYMGYRRLKKEGITTWDRDSGCVVSGEKLTAMGISLVVFWVIVFMLVIVLLREVLPSLYHYIHG